MSIKATIAAPASFVATPIAPGSYKGIATAPASLVGEIKGLTVVYTTGDTPTPTANDLVLIADGPTEDEEGMPTYNPPSGQNIIYLPSATKRYRLYIQSGPLFPGIHYTRSGNQISIDTGNISPDDKFLLCEY